MRKIILFCLLHCILIYYASAQQKTIDSLLNVLKSSKEDSNKVKVLNRITYIYINVPPLEYYKALPFAEEAQHLSEKLSYKRDEAVVLNYLATIYGYFGNYEKMFKNCLAELKIYENLNDSSRIIQSRRNLSFCYGLQGNYEKALQEELTIEKWVENSGNKQEIAYALLGEAKVYFNICKEALKKKDTNSVNTNYSKAIECEKRALKLVTDIKDSTDMGILNNSLGYIYDKCNLITDINFIKETNIIKANYYNQALESDLNALKIYEKLNDSLKKTDAYTNLGLFYRNQGDLSNEAGKPSFAEADYKKSLDYYLKVLAIIKVLGFKHGIANFSKEVGVVYLKLGELNKAQKYIHDGATGFDEIGYKEGAKDCYEKLSEADYKRGDYKNAFEDYKKISALKDSMFNEAKTKQLIEMEVKYETDKKDVALLAEQTLNKNEKEKRNLALVLGGFFIISGSFGGLALFKRRQAKSSLLTQQLENKILRAQLNPHFIFNALNSIQSFINKHPETADNYLTKFSGLMREVLESSEEEFIPLSEELSMLKKYMDIESLRVKNGFDYEIKVGSLIDEESIKVPPLILQPIIENAIWHGIANYSEKGEISISVSLIEKILKCEIENQCKGIETTTTKQEEKKKSFGLQIIKERLSLLSKEKKVNGYVRTIPTQTGMQVQLGIPV